MTAILAVILVVFLAYVSYVATRVLLTLSAIHDSITGLKEDADLVATQLAAQKRVDTKRHGEVANDLAEQRQIDTERHEETNS